MIEPRDIDIRNTFRVALLGALGADGADRQQERGALQRGRGRARRGPGRGPFGAAVGRYRTINGIIPRQVENGSG
jgi:hypothetical protein